MIYTLKGIATSVLVLINTVFWVSVLLIFSVLKLLLRVKQAQVVLSRVLVGVAEIWIATHRYYYNLIHGNKIIIKEQPELKSDQWYLIISNHICAADIPAIQAVLNRRIPFLKFFLKKILIWVPFLGLAWWALDFPFMRRYSKEYLIKNPEMKGKDMEEAQRSCEKFKQFPTSVINFVEGTRFSESKRKLQNSPYQYLLKPKAGGIGFVLGSLGEQIKYLLLVTLIYEKKAPSIWQYLSGKYDCVIVQIEKISIPEHLKGQNMLKNDRFKHDLHLWLEELWYKQDKKIESHYDRPDF
ncbi:MAG: acyltransferase [Proteobacteria bacterium]|nr:acyltransferase [Pseudomonadota bacterium]